MTSEELNILWTAALVIAIITTLKMIEIMTRDMEEERKRQAVED